MPEVLSRSGVPIVSDFDSGKGTPIVINEETGRGYVLINNAVTPLGGSNPLHLFDFEVAGDGVTDDTVNFQRAIDTAIATQRKLFVPVARYKISQPLFIMKFSSGAYTFASCEIEGEKHVWEDEFGTTIHAPRIEPTFSNLPALIIQNGRAVKISNLALTGLNTFEIGSGLTPPYYHEMMTNATFLNNGVRDSRYSPYAGIAIDPFGTSVPADGGYPGLSAYYVATASGSSHIVFESVSVKNFTVGCIITPNGTTLNAEDVFFYHSRLNYNKVGLAICQSQSRNVCWYGGQCAFNLIGFDNQLYGEQTGPPPHIWGANMAGKYLFNLSNRFGTSIDIRGVHAESFASIGFIGSSASTAQPAQFNACQFDFSSMNGIFPDHHFVTYSPTIFIGCQFTNSNMAHDAPFRFWRRSVTIPITFDTCGWSEAVQGEFPLSLSASVGGLSFLNAEFRNSLLQSDDSTRGNGTTHAIISNRQVVYQPVGYLASTPVPLGSQIQFISTAQDTIYFDAPIENNVSIGSKAVTIGASGTATFTATDADIIRTGDLIYTDTAVTLEGSGLSASLSSGWTCLGIVTNINGTTITISGWPQSLSSSTYALYMWWWPKFHSASTGDTHSNTTLDNVTNITSWKIGNKIRGSGIAEGTYISNISGTTITLSKAASATASGVRLYDANIYSLTGTPV